MFSNSSNEQNELNLSTSFITKNVKSGDIPKCLSKLDISKLNEAKMKFLSEGTIYGQNTKCKAPLFPKIKSTAMKLKKDKILKIFEAKRSLLSLKSKIESIAVKHYPSRNVHSSLSRPVNTF